MNCPAIHYPLHALYCLVSVVWGLRSYLPYLQGRTIVTVVPLSGWLANESVP